MKEIFADDGLARWISDIRSQPVETPPLDVTKLRAARARPAGPRVAQVADRSTGPDFPLPPGRRPHLGDIVISVERAVDQADTGRGGQTGDVRWSAADELRLLTTHGALHICGWDHAEPAEESAMRTLETELLQSTSSTSSSSSSPKSTGL